MDGDSTSWKHTHGSIAEKRDQGKDGKDKWWKSKLEPRHRAYPSQGYSREESYLRASGAGSTQGKIKQWPLSDHQRSGLSVREYLTGTQYWPLLRLEPCRSKQRENQQEENLLCIWKQLKFYVKNRHEWIIAPHRGTVYRGRASCGDPSLQWAANPSH